MTWLLPILSGTRKLLLKAWKWFARNPFKLFFLLMFIFWWRADARADRLRAALEELTEASKAIEAADTKADAAATVKAAERKGRVDAQNNAAREAARGADDKLRAGLDRLRAEGAGKGGQAAR
jgi:hypothetical protein